MDDMYRLWIASQSEFGAARTAENFTAVRAEGDRQYSLVRAEGGGVGAWRLTLGRLVCVGHQAPSVHNALPGNAGLLVVGTQYPYAAASYGTLGEYPPRRSYPIFGRPQYGGNGPLFGQVTAEIAWGQTSASPNRMLVDWPVLGASVVLPGGYAEALAHVHILGAGDMFDEDMPTGNALLAPVAGVYSPDGNELSLSQRLIVIGNGFGAAAAVPDFARRVQVSFAVLSEKANPADGGNPGQEFEVPLTGDRPAQLIWLDDNGRTVWTGYQRTSEPIVGGTPANAPVMWHPVPAAATMLVIKCELPLQIDEATAFLHWRISP